MTALPPDPIEEWLMVGDPVAWSNTFRPAPHFRSGRSVIEITIRGEKVERVLWSECDRDVIVILDNGHWAYGFQIKPEPNKEAEE